MKAAVLSVGAELVTGQTVDTNSAWLSAALGRLGARVVEHVTVGDETGSLSDALRRSFEHVELVIVTGGLGPTKDDLTRDAIAAWLAAPLESDAEALAQIESFFARRQRPMHEANRLQAMVPRGCRLLANRCGTAPGIRWESGKRLLYALPGVPGEMKAMFAEWVEAEVRARTGGAYTVTAALRCFGITEAELGGAIADLMARGRNPEVGTTASGAILTVRIVARGSNEGEARRLIDEDTAEVRRRLGSVVFGAGDERLQDAAGRLLLEQGRTVATAESCTGGLLAKRLTDVAGSSGYFLRGYVTYSDQSKTEVLGVSAGLIQMHGAVSAQVAEGMAAGCRDKSAADVAVSITGIAGPGGGSAEKPVGLVYVGLADGATTASKRLLLGEQLTREEVRDRSCKAALNWLRLRLIGAG